MKKIVLILVLALICFTAWCSKNQSAGDSNSVLDSIKNTYTETGENWDNRIDLERSLFDGRYVWPSSFLNSNFSYLEDKYSIELTGTVDNETKYVVFHMNDEKIGDYYAYFFYRYNGQPEPTIYYSKDGSVSRVEENQPYWYLVGREVRVIKHLTVNDFEDIVVGSTIEDVAKVDPLTAITIPNPDYYYGYFNHPELCFDTFHYTDDGILRITFARETINDEYTVSEIELNSSFEVVCEDRYRGLDGQEPLVKLQIKFEHLPS